MQGTTIFTTMSALAQEHNAINLGQGFPDFPMSPVLTEAVNHAMQSGYNQYAPMAGWLPLREVLAEKIDYLYGQSVHPDTEITITPGGTYAIYTAFTSILRPGDEVLVVQQCFVANAAAVEMAGGVAVPVNAYADTDFQVTGAALEAAVTSRSKAILISYPNNPTGAVLSREYLLEVAAVAERHDLVVLSDEPLPDLHAPAPAALEGRAAGDGAADFFGLDIGW